MIEPRHYTEKNGVYRPRLQVTLLPENVTGVPVPCDALVDSGADWCVFPEKCAEQLGINPMLPQQEIVGLYGKPITIGFCMVPIDFGFAKYKTLVGFHENVAVLGQLGFFDHFKIAFDTANRQFIITDMAIPDSDAP